MTSAFYKYASLVKNSSSYAKRMSQLSQNIFVEYPKPTRWQQLRIVAKMKDMPRELDPEIVGWWPRHPETCKLMYTLRDYGLFRDEHEDFKEEMTRLKTLRGKTKPKPGEGKRSKK